MDCSGGYHVIGFGTALLPHRHRESLGNEWLRLRDAQHIQDHNRHRPLFYLLLRPWLSLGSGEAWTRAPAIIFGLAAIALLYLLGRRLADVPASVMACLIMAIAVPELNHSQEVRMYTMASMLTLASIYLLFSWIESQRLRVLVVHIGVTYLAFLTAPTVIFGLLLAGGMCGVVLVYRRNWTAALAIAIGYGLLLLAWLPLSDTRNWRFPTVV